jgi:hypothetical protein
MSIEYETQSTGPYPLTKCIYVSQDMENPTNFFDVILCLISAKEPLKKVFKMETQVRRTFSKFALLQIWTILQLNKNRRETATVILTLQILAERRSKTTENRVS